MGSRLTFDFLAEALISPSPSLTPSSSTTFSTMHTTSQPPSAATSNPALLANLVARVVFALVGALLCWVPFRLLLRNGSLAAATLAGVVAVLNVLTCVNALLWPTDDWTRWWDGTGLCDAEVYLAAPLDTAYAAAVFALMRQLAGQMRLSSSGSAGASGGGGRDRKRAMWVQAAIIFPVPAFQMLFTYFDLAQRYIVVTLVGCSAVYDNSLPTNIVYDIPPVVFALGAVPYAILTSRRFWLIRKETRAALRQSHSGSLNLPSRRARRDATRANLRLYLMCLSILVAYVPVMGVYVAANVAATLHPRRTYDFGRVHFAQTPYPWDAVLFVPSWLVPSLVLNQPWIPIATSAAIVGFFGTGAEARDAYRRYGARVCGLGRWLSRLLPGCWSGSGDGNVLSTTTNRKKNNGEEEEKKEWWRWFGRGHTTSSRNRILLDSMDNGGLNDSSSPSPQDNRPLSSIVVPKHGAILPTVEPSPSHDGSAPTPISATGPPAIPPRDSSLRWRFAFRMPTLANMRLPALPESISGSLSSLASRSTSRLGSRLGFGRASRQGGGGNGSSSHYRREERGQGKDLAITYTAGIPSSSSFGRSFSYPFSSAYSYWGAARRVGGDADGLSVQEEGEGEVGGDDALLPLQTFNVPATTTTTTVSRAAVDALPSPNPAYPFGPRGRRNALVPPAEAHTPTSLEEPSSSAQQQRCIRIPIVQPPNSSSSSSHHSLTTATTASTITTSVTATRSTENKQRHKRKILGGGGGGLRRTRPAARTTSHPYHDNNEDDAFFGGVGAAGVMVPYTTTTITGGKDKDKDKHASASLSSSLAAVAGSASAASSGGGGDGMWGKMKKRRRVMT